jgi:dGTP triphosphohydrolase
VHVRRDRPQDGRAECQEARPDGAGTAGLGARRDALGLERRVTGTDHWPRHPLAFLTEAADDVAYLLLDLEDGFRLKHVSEAEYLASSGRWPARAGRSRRLASRCRAATTDWTARAGCARARSTR